MRIKEYRTELDKDKKNVLCEIGYYDVTEDIFDKPEKIARFAIDQLHLDRRAEEYIYVVGLTTNTQALGVFEISHGTVSTSLCNPREIFVRLLLRGASAFVVIHNHPSGDTDPSKADRLLTQKLKEAGDLIGITMIDSIIIESLQKTSANFSCPRMNASGRNPILNFSQV